MVFSLALSQWTTRARSLSRSLSLSLSLRLLVRPAAFSLSPSLSFCYTCTYSQVIFPYTPKRCLSLSLSIRRRHAVCCVVVLGSEPTPGETSSAALMDLPFQPCSVRQQEPRPSPSPAHLLIWERKYISYISQIHPPEPAGTALFWNTDQHAIIYLMHWQREGGGGNKWQNADVRCRQWVKRVRVWANYSEQSRTCGRLMWNDINMMKWASLCSLHSYTEKKQFSL